MLTIKQHRAFFAEFLVRSVGSENQRLIQAFAAVARERFLDKGPWPVCVMSGYIETPCADPRLLYQDMLIGLAPDRGINNGLPSLHAHCISACDPQPGETVVHIGAGTGYYTAILAHMVGGKGHVTAFEIEPELAAKAKVRLRSIAHATVVAGSATDGALPDADVIYVSAGATHPVRSWLAALRPSGRLLFPLVPHDDVGVMLCVRRVGDGAYTADVVCRAAFIPCIGARDDGASEALAKALEVQSIDRIRSLCLDTPPDVTVCLAGADWWFSTREIPSALEAPSQP